MASKAKWKFYEKRSNFRDFYFHKVLRRHIFEKYFNKDPYLPIYANHRVLGMNKTNQIIGERIQSGEPFMVARFGNTELSVMTSVLKRRIFGHTEENDARLKEWFQNLQDLSGFFPDQIELAEQFTDLMLDCCKETDILAMYHCHMDDYIVTEYQKRMHLFSNDKVLPEFELKTLKAIQTIAGETDDRFETWFDALEYMYQEAMKIDFDIAILGCGAYGLPLAAKLKKAGKQAIHMGGVTQILFGIKGRRWLDNPRTGIVFNDAWTFPRESETPKNCNVVENHCYW